MPGLSGQVLAQGQAITLAVPVPISGAFAANGKYAVIGAKLAAEEVAAAKGIEVNTLDLDTEGKPATAVRKVQDSAGGIVWCFFCSTFFHFFTNARIAAGFCPFSLIFSANDSVFRAEHAPLLRRAYFLSKTRDLRVCKK